MVTFHVTFVGQARVSVLRHFFHLARDLSTLLPLVVLLGLKEMFVLCIPQRTKCNIASSAWLP